MIVKRLCPDDIKPYLNDAKKAGLTFCNSTILFGLYVNTDLVAFSGMRLNKKKAIFKNSYVPHEHRGKGYFKELINIRMNLCKNYGIKSIEATCTKMSIREYLNRGFKVIKQYKEYTKVRYEII